MSFTGVNGLSFGVELEFTLWFKTSFGQDSYQEDNASPVLTLEEDERLPPALTAQTDDMVGWASRLIQDAIMAIEGSQLKSWNQPAASLEAGSLAKRIMVFHGDGWEVKTDPSVTDSDIDGPRGWTHLGIEVTSPALWDVPESLEHIRLVVHELQSRFRVRVNTRTGFHVHVGAGAKRTPGPPTQCDARHHSLDVLRRAAALMWAADGFLCHAHPPERGINQYTPSIRLASRLAYGDIPQHTQWDQPATPCELPVSMRAMPAAARRNNVFWRRESDNLFPALRPRTVDDEARKRFEVMETMTFYPDWEQLAVLTVEAGVAEIMRCASNGQVARLLAIGPAPASHRQNYNFTNCAEPYDARSGTVEFREATGSVDADWVAAWANVCLGIFRFARHASEDRFWGVIGGLAGAEADALAGRRHTYDMISLLCDLGLFAEALFLDRRLRDDPVGFWYPCRLPEGRPGPPWVEDEARSECWNPVEDDEQGDSDSGPPSSPFVASPVAWGDENTEADWTKKVWRSAPWDPVEDDDQRDSDNGPPSSPFLTTPVAWSHENGEEDRTREVWRSAPWDPGREEPGRGKPVGAEKWCCRCCCFHLTSGE